MSRLPGGTVTFLFTDVEGSTRLWEEQPAAMRTVMARHDAALAGAFEQHEGVVVRPRGEGDSLFAVFERASDAVAAALAGQQALAREDWGVIGPLRVRMALHTGEADLRDGDYYGSAVNRCARIRAAGHGGQVLLSQTTVDLVRTSLPPGASLLALGMHRLRDLSQPEAIHQLQAPDFPPSYPPLRTLDSRPNNLPVALTSFIGRERELVEAKRLLRSGRLLTLTGAGGSGKTRLALQLAAAAIFDFADGVCFVALSTVTNPDLVPAAIAQTLGVREAPGKSVAESLLTYLAEKRLLLVLDNLEQVLAAGPFIVAMLLRCPDLKVLVTSREPLHVSGEREFPVPPLTLPGNGDVSSVEALEQFAAVAMFCERAAAIRPDFILTLDNANAVAAICRRLDGLPLAIELAAVRVRALSPRAILERLERRLQLLTGGPRDVPQRQQTLRDTIAWSHDLLTPSERVIFRRLGVFAGGCTLAAVEAICAPDGVARDEEVLNIVTSLVGKSLLQQDGEEEPRFVMLETVREFASEQLAVCGELDEVQRRHATLFLVLAESTERHLAGAERDVWLARLDREHDNLRAALTWSQSRTDQHELFVRLTAALALYWHQRTHWTEGRTWQEYAVAVSDEMPVTLRAHLLDGAGMLAIDQRDYAAVHRRLLASLTVRREAGDRHGEATSLTLLGSAAWQQGDYPAARRHYEESLAIRRELGDTAGIASVLGQLGYLAQARGNPNDARPLIEQSLGAWRESGDDQGITHAQAYLGIMFAEQGDFVSSRGVLDELLASSRAAGDLRRIAVALWGLGILENEQGNYAAARRLLEESLEVARGLGDGLWMQRGLHQLGWISHKLGDDAAAVAFWEEGVPIAKKSGDPLEIAAHLYGLGLLAQRRGDFAAARALHEEGLVLRRSVGNVDGIRVVLGQLADVVAQLAEEARSRGAVADVRRLLGERLGYLRELGDARRSLAAVQELIALAEEQSDPTAVLAHTEQSLAICRTWGDRPAIAAALANLAELKSNQGSFESARELYLEALTIRRELGQPAGVAEALYDLGWLAQLEGDAPSALRRFEESIAAFQLAGHKRGAAAAMCNLAEVLCGEQRWEPAQELYARALSAFSAADDRRGAGACVEGLAGIAAARGEFERFATLLGALAALQEGQADGALGQELQEAMAKARAVLGDDAFAAAWAAGQSSSLEALVAEATAPAGRKPDSDGGSRTSSTSAPLPDGLSAREVEVLRLIALGKSNRQVADALVISLNTVLSHVSHIFGKTGCANRTEAARYAAEHGLI